MRLNLATKKTTHVFETVVNIFHKSLTGCLLHGPKIFTAHVSQVLLIYEVVQLGKQQRGLDWLS